MSDKPLSPSATHGETIAKIDKALQHVYDICQGRQKWTMRVPADVENDSDLILCEALESARKELSTVSETAPKTLLEGHVLGPRSATLPNGMALLQAEDGPRVTEERARETFDEGVIQPDNGLYSLGWYLEWCPGDPYATLDGMFEAKDLLAIAWWMTNKVKP